MQIKKTTLPFHQLRAPKLNPPSRSSEDESTPSDSFTFSGQTNSDGWKIAGMSLMLASVPIAIASRSVAVGAIGALAGVGLMFGPDN